MRIISRLVSFIVLIGIIIVPLTGIGEAPYNGEGNRIIEVCKYGPVHVPKDTKLVKCMGKVMRVLGFRDPSKEMGECICTTPCCNGGVCTIFIICDPNPQNDFYSNSSGDNSSDHEASMGQLVCPMDVMCDGEFDAMIYQLMYGPNLMF